MNMIRNAWFLPAAMVIGAILVVVGWTVDYFSSGDPHFWDSLGFAVMASAAVALVYRKWRSSSNGNSENPAPAH